MIVRLLTLGLVLLTLVWALLLVIESFSIINHETRTLFIATNFENTAAYATTRFLTCSLLIVALHYSHVVFPRQPGFTGVSFVVALLSFLGFFVTDWMSVYSALDLSSKRYENDPDQDSHDAYVRATRVLKAMAVVQILKAIVEVFLLFVLLAQYISAIRRPRSAAAKPPLTMRAANWLFHVSFFAMIMWCAGDARDRTAYLQRDYQDFVYLATHGNFSTLPAYMMAACSVCFVVNCPMRWRRTSLFVAVVCTSYASLCFLSMAHHHFYKLNTLVSSDAFNIRAAGFGTVMCCIFVANILLCVAYLRPQPAPTTQDTNDLKQPAEEAGHDAEIIMTGVSVDE